MIFLFTLVIYYATGGYDRKGYATLEEAMNAYDNLSVDHTPESHVEMTYGDTYWVINNSTGNYRPIKDTPA